MNKLKYAILGMVVAVVLAGLAACEPVTSNPQSASPGTVVVQPGQQTGLWVTGEGKVSAVPDVAIINLGIEAQAKTVAEAQNQATGAMNRVMKALTGNGVAEKDIQTQRFSITQVTRWNKDLNRDEVIGYRVTNMVTAKVRNLDKAGVVIDEVAVAGGDLTRIQNIGFTIDDPSKYYKEARDKAMADALARAKQIADGADIRLGKPTYISEGQLYVPQPRFVNYELKSAAGAPAPAPTPISAGETEIRLTVQVVYEIR
ncbi:MAG: SIMPL domain-containing protein [Chloroflexota bacterium]